MNARAELAARWLAIFGAVLSVILFPHLALADEGNAHWTAHLRWGLEYDDNPHRLDAEDQQFVGSSGAALMRYLLGGDMLTEVGSSGQVSASIKHGGKFFHRETDANAMLTEAGADTLFRPAGRLSIQLRGDVKDRTESGEHRLDYTRGGLGLRTGHPIGPLRLWADTGWRFLAFKPSPPSSYRGPYAGGGIRWMPRGDLALSASYNHAWRNYAMEAWELRDDHFVGTGENRADEHDLWQVIGRYQRYVNASLRYQFATNRSNSHGQQMSRHAVEAAVTLPVVWDVFLSARAEVQRTRYEDPVLFDDVLLLDEDNRNTVVGAVTRTIGGPWEVEFRYSLFVQEFGVGGEYRRQTVAVALRAYLDETD